MDESGIVQLSTSANKPPSPNFELVAASLLPARKSSIEFHRTQTVCMFVACCPRVQAAYRLVVRGGPSQEARGGEGRRGEGRRVGHLGQGRADRVSLHPRPALGMVSLAAAWYSDCVGSPTAPRTGEIGRPRRGLPEIGRPRRGLSEIGRLRRGLAEIGRPRRGLGR